MGTYEDKARLLAREIVAEMENQGHITTLQEARAIDVAQQGLVCANCSSPVAITDKVCGRCGSKQAVSEDDVGYRCADCNGPISDPRVKSCPHCRGVKVTRADPSFKYECLRCGKGVTLEQSSCSCGETRAVPRPVADVIS